MSVCISVCLSAHILVPQKPHVQTSGNVRHMSNVAVGGLGFLRRQCSTLRTSGFVNDFVFSHNGANGAESNTDVMFRRVRQVAAPGRSLISCWFCLSFFFAKVVGAISSKGFPVSTLCVFCDAVHVTMTTLTQSQRQVYGRSRCPDALYP